MNAIRRVMTCVDVSEYSKETIEFSLALTEESKMENVFFSVVDSRDIDAVKMAARYYPELVYVQSFIEKATAERQQHIKDLIKEHFPSVTKDFKIIVQVGHPVGEILEAIETEKIDLVVMGNKGSTNLTRTLFGSVAEKVFRHSPVPVLSFRDRKKFHRD